MFFLKSASSWKRWTRALSSQSLKISGVYLLVGTLWILLSDTLVHSVVKGEALGATIDYYKGCFYILATTLLLYTLIARYERRVERSREAARSSEERLQLAMASSSLVVWELDPVTGSLNVQGKALASLGINTGKGSMDDLAKIVHPDDLQGLSDWLKGDWSGTEPRSITFRVLEGEECVYIQALGRLVLLPGRGPLVLGMARDCTKEVLWQKEVEDSDLRRTALFDNAPDGIVVLNDRFEVVEANESFARMLGVDLKAVKEMRVQDWDVTVQSRELEEMRDAPQRTGTVVTKWLRRDGQEIDVEVNYVGGLVGGEVISFSICRDITAQVSWERSLKQSEEQFRTLVECSPNGIILAHEDGRIKMVNREIERIFGLSREDAIGKVVDRLFAQNKENRDKLSLVIGSFCGSDTVHKPFELVAHRHDGQEVHLDVGFSHIECASGERLVLATFVDSMERWNDHRTILRLALQDDVTELPNRHSFLSTLEMGLGSHLQGAESFGVGLIDIDQFRVFNEHYGQEFGNKVLIEAAKRLAACLGPSDILARVGGDEFAVIVHEPYESSRRLEEVLHQASHAFAKPMSFAGTMTHLTASIGACRAPRHANTVEGVLACLDIALFEAKNRGRGHFVMFREKLGLEAKNRHETERALVKAVEREEFVVFYQPIVNAVSERIVGCEALVRWNHPEKGILCPAEFIDIVEETNLIVPMGRQVLASACRQMGIWQEQYGIDLHLSVNLSPKQFADAALLDVIEDAIDTSQLRPGTLQLELTESHLEGNGDLLLALLRQIKAMGATIAIDDFGTGYSSLSRLKDYPIDCLKVDRSFVGSVLDDPDSAAICRTIMTLAHSLNLKVIAEGVETSGQADFLRELNCEEAQGYLFGRPMSAEAFDKILDNEFPQLRLAI